MDVNAFRKWVGKESVPVKNEVEKGAIRKFAEAIGDPNPLYHDEAYAKPPATAGSSHRRRFSDI